MAALTSTDPNVTYKDILQLGSGTGTGITSSLQTVRDGLGGASVLKLSTTAVEVTGTFTINGVSVPTNLTIAGGFGITLTATGTTNVTLPTSGTLITNTVTSLNSLTSATSLATLAALTTVGTIGSGTWQGTLVGPTYGGTGVNNGSKTITLGGNLTTSGANNVTFTTAGPTNVTLPTSGTLSTTTGTVTSVATAGLATGGPITSTGTVTVTAATAAQQNTGTDTTTVVTPGQQYSNPSALKAWANVTNSGTITNNDSFGISTVVRNSTGNVTVTLSKAMTNTTYVALGILQQSGQGTITIAIGSTTSFVVTTYNSSFVLADLNFSVMVCGHSTA